VTEPALLLAPENAAQLLGCGRTHVYTLLRRGELKSIRVGRLRRIPRSEIEAYIMRQLQQECR